MKYGISVILLFVTVLFGCQPKQLPKEFFAEVNGRLIPIIRLDLVKDSATVVPLSTLFEDVEIIPLETRPECLVGYSSNFLTDHSVITGVRNYGAPIRLYEFDLNGKFIQELGGVGKGPGEHQGSMMGPVTFYPEDGSIIASFAGASDEEQLFDREGHFIKTIDLPWDMGSTVYRIADDLFLSAGIISGTPKFKKDSFQIVLHRSNGDWVKSFPRKNYPAENSTGFSWKGTTSLWRYSNTWRLLSTGNDTIYQVTEEALNPVALVNFGQKHFRYNESFNPQTEVGRYTINILRETDRFLYLQKEHLYKLEAEELAPGWWSSTIYRDYSLILNDKEKGDGYNIRFKDDLLGILPPEKHGMDCSWDEFGHPYRIAQAFQVLEWIAEAKKNQRIPADAWERILKLEQTINENSNPVMFLFKQRDEKEVAGRMEQLLN